MVVVAALGFALWATWYVRRTVTAVTRPEQASTLAERIWPGAVFGLEHVSHHRYVLRNDGNDTAYGVRVDVRNLVRHEGSIIVDRFPPGHAERYMLIQPLELRVSEITVSWHDRPDHLDAPRSVRLPLHTVTDPYERHGM
ncbi:hypothetical protein [Haloactinopolyspora alba]|uniref:hypothetical protein n=1 Tax=Haloactinopolyspora alba TaxID=648780 RepID=UPI00101D53B3|nr:hypothetical protein [Haloactinopolyspora alba]